MDFSIDFIIITNSNLALLNSLALWHPLMLYTYFTFIFIFFKRKICIHFDVIFIKNKNLQSPIILIAIFLGIFWSSQELLWGGFWNWDFVELTLLLLVIITLIHTHLHRLKALAVLIFFYKNFLFVILLYFLINRTNLINSQHLFSASWLFDLPQCYIFTIFTIATILLIIFSYKNIVLHFMNNLSVIILYNIYLSLLTSTSMQYIFSLNIQLNEYFFKTLLNFVYVYTYTKYYINPLWQTPINFLFIIFRIFSIILWTRWLYIVHNLILVSLLFLLNYTVSFLFKDTLFLNNHLSLGFYFSELLHIKYNTVFNLKHSVNKLSNVVSFKILYSLDFIYFCSNIFLKKNHTVYYMTFGFNIIYIMFLLITFLNLSNSKLVLNKRILFSHQNKTLITIRFNVFK